MRKKITYVIVALFSFAFSADGRTCLLLDDSTQKTNLIEIGATSAAYPGGSYAAWGLRLHSGISAIPGSFKMKSVYKYYPKYFSFFYRKLFGKNHCIAISYENIHTVGDKLQPYKTGSMGYMFRNWSFGYGYVLPMPFLLKGKVRLLPVLSLVHREGLEQMIIGFRSSVEPFLASVGYNSFGCSGTMDGSYILGKRFSCGVSVVYAYFFKDPTGPGDYALSFNPVYWQSYQPNRQMITMNIKFGFLF